MKTGERKGIDELVSKDDSLAPTNGKPPRKPINPRNAEGNVGKSLRTAYEQAVNEDVPAEMLDLLGRLR